MIEESFTDKSQTFYFTFGVDSQLADKYVKINAPSELAARFVMCQHFGHRWASFHEQMQWWRYVSWEKYTLLVTFTANEEHDKIATRENNW